jgi:hypothetical protein
LAVLCASVSSTTDLRHDSSNSLTYSSSHSLLNNLFNLAVNTGKAIISALFDWTGSKDRQRPVQTDAKNAGTLPVVTIDHSNLPDPPSGAHVVQLYACQDVNATVPVLVNQAWLGQWQSIERVFITQHGAAYDPENYFEYINKYVVDDDQKTLVMAPAFYRTTTSPAPSSFYLPDVNLAWPARPDQWPVGTNAAAPGSLLTPCSSFDAYDTLLGMLSDKTNFPQVNRVTIMGHSGGGNMVSRYAQLNSHASSLHVRYLVMNPANHAFLTDARPVADADSCAKAFAYPYQLDVRARSLPSWVSGQLKVLISGLGVDSDPVKQLFTRWAARDVVLLVGDRDTAKTGTQKCQSVVQGGSARSERNYGFWTYVNILAGRGATMKNAFGYEQLIDSGAKAIVTDQTTFNHQYCVVAGVAHDEPGLLASACGQAALFDDTLPSAS